MLSSLLYLPSVCSRLNKHCSFNSSTKFVFSKLLIGFIVPLCTLICQHVSCVELCLNWIQSQDLNGQRINFSVVNDTSTDLKLSIFVLQPKCLLISDQLPITIPHPPLLPSQLFPVPRLFSITQAFNTNFVSQRFEF